MPRSQLRRPFAAVPERKTELLRPQLGVAHVDGGAGIGDDRSRPVATRLDAIGLRSAHVDRAATVVHGRIATDGTSKQAAAKKPGSLASTTVKFPAASILALPLPRFSAWMAVEFAPPVTVMPGPS